MSQTRQPAGRPTGGQFAPAPQPDAEVTLVPLTAVDRDGRQVTLDPSSWNADAEHVFMNGQCLPLAVTLARHFELPLTVAWNRSGTVIVHAFVQDGDQVIDASSGPWRNFASIDDLRDAHLYEHGDLGLETFDDPDDVRAQFEQYAADGKLGHDLAWDVADAMLPAWLAEHLG